MKESKLNPVAYLRAAYPRSTRLVQCTKMSTVKAARSL